MTIGSLTRRWAASPRNLVAFPGLARRNTTAANVLARAAYAKEQTVTLLLPSTVEMPSRMPGGGGEGAMAGQGGGEGAEGGEAAAAAGDVHSRVGRRAIVGMSLPVPGLDLAGGEVDVEVMQRLRSWHWSLTAGVDALVCYLVNMSATAAWPWSPTAKDDALVCYLVNICSLPCVSDGPGGVACGDEGARGGPRQAWVHPRVGLHSARVRGPRGRPGAHVPGP